MAGVHTTHLHRQQSLRHSNWLPARDSRQVRRMGALLLFPTNSFVLPLKPILLAKPIIHLRTHRPRPNRLQLLLWLRLVPGIAKELLKLCPRLVRHRAVLGMEAAPVPVPLASLASVLLSSKVEALVQVVSYRVPDADADE